MLIPKCNRSEQVGCASVVSSRDRRQSITSRHDSIASFRCVMCFAKLCKLANSLLLCRLRDFGLAKVL
jgi:hypothetical protein